MISYVKGTVQAINGEHISVEMGPIGITIRTPYCGQYAVNESIFLHIYLHWNQEDGPTLFGFADEVDRTIFKLIISCSGIGPKIGLAVLSDIGAASFVHALQSDDVPALNKVSGIGTKKAEQIIVQLRRQVAKLLSSGAIPSTMQGAEHWQSLSEALTSLKYSRTEIQRALHHVRGLSDKQVTAFDSLMREALSFLAKRV